MLCHDSSFFVRAGCRACAIVRLPAVLCRDCTRASVVLCDELLRGAGFFTEVAAFRSSRCSRSSPLPASLCSVPLRLLLRSPFSPFSGTLVRFPGTNATCSLPHQLRPQRMLLLQLRSLCFLRSDENGQPGSRNRSR